MRTKKYQTTSNDDFSEDILEESEQSEEFEKSKRQDEDDESFKLLTNEYYE